MLLLAADAPKRTIEDWSDLHSPKKVRERDAAIRETVALLLKHLRENKEFQYKHSVMWPSTHFLATLGKLGQVAPQPLLDELPKADAGMRASIAHAISAMPEPPDVLVDPLIKLLDDDDKETKRQAAHAFRPFGPRGKKAIPALVRTLADKKNASRGGLRRLGVAHHRTRSRQKALSDAWIAGEK